MRKINKKLVRVLIGTAISFACVIFASIFVTNEGFSLKKENPQNLVVNANVSAKMHQKAVQKGLHSGTVQSSIASLSADNKKILITKNEQITSEPTNYAVEQMGNNPEKVKSYNLNDIKESVYKKNFVTPKSTSGLITSSTLTNSKKDNYSTPVNATGETDIISSVKSTPRYNAGGGPPPTEHTPPTLPVGEGWTILLLLAIGYVGVKKFI